MNRKLNPLTENHLFTKAYRVGVSDVNKLVAVYIMKNIKRTADGGLMPTAMGIAVNAKLGGAVQRNRVKRIIREGYRACLPNIKEGLIIVISARGAAFSKSADSPSMARAIGDALGNLGAYKDQSLKKKDDKSVFYKKDLRNKNAAKKAQARRRK